MDEQKEAAVLSEDEIAENVFNAHEELSAEKENSEEKSSAPEPTTEDESKKSEDESEDSLKTPEESDKKDDESEATNKDQMFRKGYNEAKTKLEKRIEELKSQVVDVEKLKEFERVTSSPEYIRASMKAQGYTDDAINNRLKEAGHNVIGDDDLVNVVYKKLGVNPAQLDDNTKAVLSDVVKVAEAISEYKLGRTIPEAIKPLQDRLMQQDAKDGASQAIKSIKSTVEKENILDYKEEVEPILSKWLDENPKATQEDFVDYFRQVNHELAIKKLSTKGRKLERDEKKQSLRTSKEGTLPFSKDAMTGNFDDDFDRVADALGVK